MRTYLIPIALAACAGVASADMIRAAHLPNGANAASGADGFWAATANGGSFAHHPVQANAGVGISGGSAATGIDSGESISFFFGGPVRIASLDLGQFFRAPGGTSGPEIAQFQVYRDGHSSPTTFTLRADGTATGFGSAVEFIDINPANGVVRIRQVGGNIFGDLVTAITMTVPGAESGDFTFLGIDYFAISSGEGPGGGDPVVPTPTAALLGAAGLGLAGCRRRRA